MESNVVFIVGIGRSGTSLLHAMLNAHSEIALTPESHFYKKYIANKKSRKIIENGSFDHLLNILNNDDEFKRLGLEPVQCITKYREQFNDILDLKNFYILLLDLYRKRLTKNIPGDKDPNLILYIDEIVDDFSEAKIIHVVRDPRGVLASREKATWSMRYPFFLQALVCAAQLRIGLHKSDMLNTENYMEILYEDLIADPVEILTKTCSFIGVSFEEEMLNFQKSASILVSSNEMQWKKTTLGPLLKNNSEKWRMQLNKREVFIAEQVCSQAFKVFSYKVEGFNFPLIYGLYGVLLRFGGYLFYRVYNVKMRI